MVNDVCNAFFNQERLGSRRSLSRRSTLLSMERMYVFILANGRVSIAVWTTGCNSRRSKLAL